MSTTWKAILKSDLIVCLVCPHYRVHYTALSWYPLLQMLFLGPMYPQLTFLWTCRCFSTCLSCTIASTSCLFWDLRILPSQILHLHPTFSMTCGCFPSKFCIFNLLFLWLADTPPSKLCIFNPRKFHIADFFPKYHLRSIYFIDWANKWLTKNWYKKFERIWNERWRTLRA